MLLPSCCGGAGRAGLVLPVLHSLLFCPLASHAATIVCHRHSNTRSAALPGHNSFAAGFVFEHGPFLFSFKGGKDPSGRQRQELVLTENPHRCGRSGSAWREVAWEPSFYPEGPRRKGRVKRFVHAYTCTQTCIHKMYTQAHQSGLAAAAPPRPCSWSRVANVLYVDSPAGVGMSYYETQADRHTNDTQTAKVRAHASWLRAVLPALWSWLAAAATRRGRPAGGTRWVVQGGARHAWGRRCTSHHPARPLRRPERPRAGCALAASRAEQAGGAGEGCTRVVVLATAMSPPPHPPAHPPCRAHLTHPTPPRSLTPRTQPHPNSSTPRAGPQRLPAPVVPGVQRVPKQ